MPRVGTLDRNPVALEQSVLGIVHPDGKTSQTHLKSPGAYYSATDGPEMVAATTEMLTNGALKQRHR
jgi:hypothetical protein